MLELYRRHELLNVSRQDARCHSRPSNRYSVPTQGHNQMLTLATHVVNRILEFKFLDQSQHRLTFLDLEKTPVVPLFALLEPFDGSYP